MTFVAPVDTGIWQMSCNDTGSSASHHHGGWPTDCAGWNGKFNSTTRHHFAAAPLGSMDHHLHLYLQNTRFWNLTDAGTVTLTVVITGLISLLPFAPLMKCVVELSTPTSGVFS
jgi:hypothetical protein